VSEDDGHPAGNEGVKGKTYLHIAMMPILCVPVKEKSKSLTGTPRPPNPPARPTEPTFPPRARAPRRRAREGRRGIGEVLVTENLHATMLTVLGNHLAHRLDLQIPSQGKKSLRNTVRALREYSHS
jgi:hypothetical protein